MLAAAALVMAAAAAPAMAQLASMRATIPGALHQCEDTSLVFFDTGNARPASVLFLPSASIPDSLRSGTTTLEEAQQYGPLLAIGDIETADAAAYSFELQIAQDQVFEMFGFLPDGSGKALSLTRTVMTPLPGATSCLTNIPTSLAVGTVTTSVSAAQPTSTGASSAAAGSSSVSAASSFAAASSATTSSSTSGAAPAATSAGGGNAASSFSVDKSLVLGWTVAIGGVVLAASGFAM
ncbi:hypothetical protein JCM10207_008058 [Rhodosporidiobolus poonsookiae]